MERLGLKKIDLFSCMVLVCESLDIDIARILRGRVIKWFKTKSSWKEAYILGKTDLIMGMVPNACEPCDRLPVHLRVGNKLV